MIQKYVIKEYDIEVIRYRIRIFQRSRINHHLRVSRQEGGIPTEAQAIKREQQLKKEIERELFDLESKGVLFSDLVSGWDAHTKKMKVATGSLSEITQGDYLGSVKKWLKDYWNRPAVEVNAYVLTEIFHKIKMMGLSYKLQKKLKHILKTIFDFGIQSGQLSIPRSPTFKVTLKKDTEKKPEILTNQEIQLLLEKAYESNHEWKRVWAMALLTGLRSGELYALEWSDINWENKLINVNKSYNCRTRSFKSTKAGYWRQVPISQDLETILRDQQSETGSTQHVFPRQWEWSKGLQARVLRRFCYLYGLPSIKFHTLRACFSTQMLRNGVEAAKVMKICGWKELKTMQIYIRLAGIEVDGVTEGLKLFPNGLKRNQE